MNIFWTEKNRPIALIYYVFVRNIIGLLHLKYTKMEDQSIWQRAWHKIGNFVRCLFLLSLIFHKDCPSHLILVVCLQRKKYKTFILYVFVLLFKFFFCNSFLLCFKKPWVWNVLELLISVFSSQAVQEAMLLIIPTFYMVRFMPRIMDGRSILSVLWENWVSLPRYA